MEIEHGQAMEFIESEKQRLLNEYNCKTIQGVLLILKTKLEQLGNDPYDKKNHTEKKDNPR